MTPMDDIGASMGIGLGDIIATAFEAAMLAIWEASLFILRGAFTLADRFTTFSVDTRTGPISVLWPMMLWISGVLALGLFFWQLIVTNLRGGRGFLRLVVGPLQYGIALAVTVGIVATFLAAVDGLTNGILQYGLRAKNFTDALDSTSFGDAIVDGIKAVVLAICALIGVIPAAIGYILEMLFREAAIYLLVGITPLVAAGLLANITAFWFWWTCRALLVCIVMEPALALALVLGVAIAGGAEGFSGLLAGVGVLIISLFFPFVLFRLFAFVDPNTDAGSAFRDALAGIGIDSYGGNNPALMAAGAILGHGGSGAIEAANTDRFDDADAGGAEDSLDDWDGPAGGDPDPLDWDDVPLSPRDPIGGSDPGDSDPGGGDAGSDFDEPLPANAGRVVSSSRSTGPSGSYGDDNAGGGSDEETGGGSNPPEPPSPTGGPSSPDPGGGGPASGGGGGETAGATEAEESAVIP